MNIDIDLLYTWGAVAKKYEKNEILFFEDDKANFYYQIVKGRVKMYNCNEDGKEYIQGVFKENMSFGEPPLFINETYPANAITLENSIILKISKDKLFRIMEENPAICMHFITSLSKRVYAKTMTSKQIIILKPKCRILHFLEQFKKENEIPLTKKTQIQLTRQQLADYTGLRVETVIRTLSELQKEQKISIENHKLYF